MVKKYRFFVLGAFCVCLAVASFLFYFSGPLFDPQYKLKKESYALLFERAVQFGATDETFKGGKIKVEDFYKKKIVFEGGFLGDRKFEIPKAYIGMNFGEISDREVLTEKGSIFIKYTEPNKLSLIETVLTDGPNRDSLRSGMYGSFIVSKGGHDFIELVMSDIKKAKLSPADNLFGLVAYKFPLRPGIDPDYQSRKITYVEYEGDVARSFIKCDWDPKIQVETPDGLCDKEQDLDSLFKCQSFKEKKRRIPSCLHFFDDKNLTYGLTFPFSDLKNWKQNRADTTKFFNGFEVKTADGSKQ